VNKFSTGQYKQVAEILGNLSVAWFSAGVIAPVVIGPKFSQVSTGSLAISLLVSGVFAIISISLADKIK